MESRPSRFPSAWPTDGRSKLHNSDKGWRLTHPDRTPMIYTGEKWIDEPARTMEAA